METLSYDIIINAPKDKIWDVLSSEKTYGEWTKFFNEGSAMKSDWQVGGKTYFVNGDGEGMVSTIEDLEKPNLITFKHLGMVDKDGNEDTESMEVKQWSGSFERYYLIDLEDKVKLHVEVQIDKAHHDFMNDAFPKGLQVVKELAEKN